MSRSGHVPSRVPRWSAFRPCHCVGGRLQLPLPAAICAVFLSLTVAAGAGMFTATAGAASAPATLKVTPTAFSPNGDKVKDRITVRITLRAKARLTVVVYAPDGKPAATLCRQKTVAAGTRSFRWNGRKAGRPMGNGTYQVRAKITVSGKLKVFKRAVTLDTSAPSVEVGELSTSRVFGGATSRLPFVANEKLTRVRLDVYTAAGPYGADGKRIARVTARTAAARGSVGWDGTNGGGAYVSSGQHKIRFVGTDAAGNTGTSRFAAISVWAPRQIRGTVRRSGGEAVAGATVRVEGTALKTVTAADGSFSFESCPMGFRVFTATKKGQPGARRRLSVDLGTGSVDLVLGKSDPASRSSVRDSTVTISGQLFFRDADGSGLTPLRDVRVLLQDDAITYWDDLEETETRTDDYGRFSITYDYDDIWDSWNEPDVRVVAYAEDGGEEVCAVYWDEISVWPYVWAATGCWNNNKSDRTGIISLMNFGDRVAWFILDCMQRAHDRWRSWTGWDRSSVDVVFPEDMEGESGTYSWLTDSIDLDDDGDEWEATTSYHEYGHALHREAYDVTGPATSIYDAYSDATRGCATWVPAKHRWYSYQGEGGYSTEGEGNHWTQFKEGFAEYFAALMHDCDKGAMENTLERDVDHPGIDDAVCMHSISRVLWDFTDDGSTKLYSSWNEGTGGDTSACRPVQRMYTDYGTGDDDRLQGFGSPPQGGMLAKIWTVLHNDWPASLRELRDHLVGRYGGSEVDRRGIEAVLYRMGIDPTDITQTRPVVVADSLIVRDAQGTESPYRGLVELWCRVTDPDVVHGDPDIDHVRVRFECRYEVGGSFSVWAPIDCALAPAAGPPPGRTGTGWYKVVWDTRAPSPVELLPNVAEVTGAPEAGYKLNTARQTPMVTTATAGPTARRDRMYVRAVAFDGLAESDPVTFGPFAVDNLPSPFGGQGRADGIGDHLYWDDGHVPKGDLNTITWKPFTYELFFTPANDQAGRIFEYSLGYKNQGAGHGERCEIMYLEKLADGRLRFMVNQYDGSGPGGGTWHSVYSTTHLQTGVRYHILAETGGGAGMKLFVDGRAEYGTGSDGAGYTACPQADWSDGTLYGGWFSLGVYADFIAGKPTALGGYDEVRLSCVQRYANDFTPPTSPLSADADTVLLDHLDGTTSGVTGGFLFETL